MLLAAREKPWRATQDIFPPSRPCYSPSHVQGHQERLRVPQAGVTSAMTLPCSTRNRTQESVGSGNVKWGFTPGENTRTSWALRQGNRELCSSPCSQHCHQHGGTRVSQLRATAGPQQPSFPKGFSPRSALSHLEVA